MSLNGPDTEASTADFERIGRAMIETAIRRAAGQESDYCIGGKPTRRYYVSNLTPESEKDDDDDELFTETTPSTIGLQVQPQADQLGIGVAFEIYIRSLPTCREYADEVPDEYDPTTDNFYIKERVTFADTLDLAREQGEEADRLTAALNETLHDTVKSVEEERVIHPTQPITADVDELVDPMSTDPTALSDTEYEAFLDAVGSQAQLRHEWELELDIEMRDDDVEIRLTNDIPDDVANGRDATVDHELGLLNPEIRVRGGLKPYELDIVSEDFRYDRRIWGKGLNCSVALRTEDSTESEEPSDVVSIETQTVPQNQTYRFVHRGEEDRYETDVKHLVQIDDEFDTSLESLWRGSPIEILHAMADGMRSYLSEWEGALRRQKREELDPPELEEYDEAAQQFRREIDNFERGIEVLENCPDGMRAFRMMNRAFAEQPEEERIPGWRPFQIVFIVSNVSSILAREYEEFESHRDDEVEVLWFPTGGGKTEAYLGLVVFALFFDRLRGKERGVTAWIRFPLTLLGSQQLRRFLRVLTHANAVREELSLPGERFSIGYYAGSDTTPNRIGGRNTLDTQFEGPNGDRILREKCQSIESCPRCDAPVDVEWRPAEHAVAHVCTGETCDVDDLPLYVTDHEIYRNVPSVLLGTLVRLQS